MTRRGIPGMKTCRICGRVYSPRALWCPNCYDDFGQPRIIQMIATGGVAPETETAAKAVVPTLPQPRYPDWLIAAEREITFTCEQLAYKALRHPESPTLLDLALAVIAIREHEAIPLDVDMERLEIECRNWLGGEWAKPSVVEAAGTMLVIKPAEQEVVATP